MNREDIFNQRVEILNSEIPGYAENWKKLSEILLAIGGDVVVPMPFADQFLSHQVNRGRVMEPTSVRLELGEPSNCFENSENIVNQSNSHGVFCVGYALSDDGLWREHGWVWDQRDGSIVETTVLRECYFGIGINTQKEDEL